MATTATIIYLQQMVKLKNVWREKDLAGEDELHSNLPHTATVFPDLTRWLKFRTKTKNVVPNARKIGKNNSFFGLFHERVFSESSDQQTPLSSSGPELKMTSGSKSSKPILRSFRMKIC